MLQLNRLPTSMYNIKPLIIGEPRVIENLRIGSKRLQQAVSQCQQALENVVNGHRGEPML